MMQNVALFLAGWFAAAAGFGVLIGKCIAFVARPPERPAGGAQILPLRRPSVGRQS